MAYRIHGKPTYGKVYAHKIDLSEEEEIEDLRERVDSGDCVLLVDEISDAAEYGFDIDEIEDVTNLSDEEE